MFDLHRFLGFEASGLPRFVTFLLTLFPTESSASISFKAERIECCQEFCFEFLKSRTISVSEQNSLVLHWSARLWCPLATVSMLGIQWYLLFDAPLWRFLGSPRSRYCRAARHWAPLPQCCPQLRLHLMRPSSSRFPETDWPRPGRCSLPWRLRLLQTNVPSRCSYPRCPSITAPI